MRFLAFTLLSLIPACQADETLRVWTLSEINGQPFPARATLTLSEKRGHFWQSAVQSVFGQHDGPIPLV